MGLPSGIASDREVAERSSSRGAWRSALPVLRTPTAVLREVAAGDALSLSAALGTRHVQQYLPIGPTTEAQFARFIRWVRCERRNGRYVCFSVVPHHRRAAAGLFQLWPVELGFHTAELGFALDERLWGTGTFSESATAIIDFAVDVLNVHRLEFRSAVNNARGAAALRKLGAVSEGTLRRCFRCPAGLLDHTISSILSDDWRDRRTGARRPV